MKRRAYRVETERLVLRCWNPADAPLLQRALEDNLHHLRPWMPWVASEPESIETKVARLRTFRARFDLDEDFVYGVFDPDETEVWGGTGLHTRVGADAREIGYWVHVEHVDRGLATELSAALTRVAFEIDGVRRVHIHCDPLNVASAAVPRKLGFTCEATLRERDVTADGEPRDTQVWTLLRREYPASPPARARIRAFDARGLRIDLEGLS